MRLWRRGLGFIAVILITAWVATCDKDRGEEREEDAASASLPPTARPDMVAELRRARDVVRSPSDGGGKAWLELADGEEPRVQVRERRRWTIVYEAGSAGIAKDGFVRLAVNPFWEWSPPNLIEGYPGFTTAECEADGVELESFEGADWVDFRIGGRDLRSGERIRIVYGAGEARALSDKFAESGSRFWILVDGDGDGVPRTLADSPQVTVVPGPPAQISALLPSTAAPGERVALTLAVLDALGNGPSPFEGTIELAVLPGGLELPENVELTSADGGKKRLEFQTTETGVFRVHASTGPDDGHLVALSNPMLVETDVAQIRWGDLHGHSNLSDGTGSPDEYFSFARDVAALDVISLTDHDHWGMLFLDEHPEIWKSIQDATERFHEPGRFVTLLGYEWTNWIHGHRHVLYFADEGPLYSSLSEEYERPDQLWNALRGKPALTFAHHSAGGPIATNWDYAPDPELEPVTEVVSVHGASEGNDAPMLIYSPLKGNFVRDALDRGYRLGFIGSGDSHDGHPGLTQIASGASGGLAAILSDELTREGVRAALKARRCYATNGPRIVLRAVLEGRRMGESVPPNEPGKAAQLLVRAVGTVPIAVIDVIRGGEVVASLPGEDAWELLTTVELDPLQSGEYVYVRVVQDDLGAAWSSPFFVE